MADNGKVVKSEVDKSDWRWVKVPAKDLYGATNDGVSINFVKYEPERNEEGVFTGREGKYFLDPITADEVERLQALKLAAEMRVLQPTQDQKLFEILRRGGKAIPNQTNF